MQPLILENVTKRYGEHTAVNRLNLSVGEGEIFGLLGANGAGKTTTMRMVLGIIEPDEGRIVRQGRPGNGRISDQMGYLPEERGLYPKIKVKDQIVYLAQLRGMGKAEADRQLKLWLERFDVPEYYDKKIEELSKGNQQKIQFIAAVLHRPAIVIMDEAFSGLDPVNVELLKETVKELRNQGTTILFSTHRMEHVEELCENICILHKSNAVLEGKVSQIKQAAPKEKVRLRTERPLHGLEQIPGVDAVRGTESGYEIRIREEAAAQAILQTAAAQTSVQHFQIMEPTMNEIFIQAVGGKPDA